MSELLSRLVVFQVVIDLIKILVGTGLCFGALKWRRGLLSVTASYWGLFLGAVVGFLLDADIEVILICALIGLILFLILTYTIPGVNRFVLGFLVSSKLFFMLMTVLAESGDISIELAIIIPLIAGTVVGLILMAWTRVRVSAFVLGCTFIGASDIAPIISEWINRGLFAATGNINYLFNPIHFLFALFNIDLTDLWTLIVMIVLMVLGCFIQIRNLKNKNIPLNTPVIAFEVPRADNGKLYINDKEIYTMK